VKVIGEQNSPRKTRRKNHKPFMLMFHPPAKISPFDGNKSIPQSGNVKPLKTRSITMQEEDQIKEVGEVTKRERRYGKKRGHFCPRNH
jgi:hypothetical protein